MSRTLMIVVLSAASAVAALVLLGAAGRDDDAEAQKVLVTNFPESQSVSGSVSVNGPVHTAALRSITKSDVWPVAPNEISRLVPAGSIETDGFASAVLSLTGQVRGDSLRTGEVGAFLIPDEPLVQRALEEKGLMLFPLEVKASCAAGSLYFTSSQPRLTLGFTRYRVLLYNTTDKTVSVQLYAYLTN